MHCVQSIIIEQIVSTSALLALYTKLTSRLKAKRGCAYLPPYTASLFPV